jgi:hypothetical protein
MAKSLSESAAEILSASLGSSKKEPMQALGAPVNDVGGATPTDDYSAPGQSGDTGSDSSMGKNTAKPIKAAAKPGNPNAPVEASKGTLASEDTETSGDELTEEEIEEYLNSLSEEELAALEEEALDEMGSVKLPLNKGVKAPLKKGATLANPQMPGKSVKEMVEENMTSCMEDVDALFNGESLSEDFRNKATTIFEAAVKSRVEAIVEKIVAQNEQNLSEEVNGVRQELSEQVDSYLNYVVEEWMKENEVAVTTGLRSELTEDFINGLKNLFAEHYIELPEEKIDVTEALAAQVAELEEQLVLVAESASELAADLNEAKKHEAIRQICEGLTEVQIGKMKSLAESVEFTSAGDFNNKLTVIRENYFPSTSSKPTKVETVSEDASDESAAAEDVSNIMSHYVNAITKSLPK